MKKLLLKSLGALSVLLWWLSGCTADVINPNVQTTVCDSTITYNNHIKSIIDSKCAVSGCHDGSVAPNATSYDNLNGSLTSGTFENRVLVIQDMPLGTDTLTTEELELITCWKEDGYQE